jgi:hypothetical protein
VHHHHKRWLHTRISEVLEDALKREARRRRLPVSSFVRNVLEGALDLVEDIVETTTGVRGTRHGDGAADVYGWQELILNRPGTCARCDAAFGAGTKAFRGLRDQVGPPVFLCVACVRRLRQSSQPREREEESR